MDECIRRHMQRVYNLLIGERTAEEIKMEIGSAFPTGDEKTMEVRGRDIVAGLPKTMTITSEEIRDALQEPVASIVDAVRVTLGNCEPELAADLVDRGIVLSGGSSQLRGLAFGRGRGNRRRAERARLPREEQEALIFKQSFRQGRIWKKRQA